MKTILTILTAILLCHSAKAQVSPTGEPFFDFSHYSFSDYYYRAGNSIYEHGSNRYVGYFSGHCLYSADGCYWGYVQGSDVYLYPPNDAINNFLGLKSYTTGCLRAGGTQPWNYTVME